MRDNAKPLYVVYSSCPDSNARCGFICNPDYVDLTCDLHEAHKWDNYTDASNFVIRNKDADFIAKNQIMNVLEWY